MDYPLDKLKEIARKIQDLLGEYRERSYSLDSRIPWEEAIKNSKQASDNFMRKIGTEVLPQVQRCLGEIEALLGTEDRAIAEQIIPILKDAQKWASHPVNPLVYAELSSILMRLAGHLSVRPIIRPLVFVGYRYAPEDEKIAEKFIKLFQLEGLNCISGKTAKAEDVDDKIKTLIAQSEGVIVIFTKEKELKEGGWTTSGWLTDEKAYAMGRDRPVILFFEDCISSAERKGIQGQLEYIEFRRDNLGETLLEAIPYLRDFRQRILLKRK